MQLIDKDKCLEQIMDITEYKERFDIIFILNQFYT